MKLSLGLRWRSLSRRQMRPVASGLVIGLVLGFLLLGLLRRGDRFLDRSARTALGPDSIAPSDGGSGDLLRRSRTTAIVTAVEMTRRSVVTIRAAGPVEVRSPMLDLFRFPAGRPRTVEREWVGSGFLVDRIGLVVTMAHVVEGATDLSISLGDGTSALAEVVGVAPRFDLALLRADLGVGTAASAALLGNSEDVMVGEWVIAIGSPFGDTVSDPQPSVSVGVISAVKRDMRPPETSHGTWPYFNLLQTDAAINSGNSGGPLVNTNGEVIGVNMALLNPQMRAANVGVNFSVPINTVKWVVEELNTFGAVRSPWVGWQLAEAVPPATRKEIGLAEEDGQLLVSAVEAGSPAQRAGIRAGDLLMRINDLEPYSLTRAERILFETRVGDSIRAQVMKDGQPVDVMLEVLENPTVQAERLERASRRAPG